MQRCIAIGRRVPGNLRGSVASVHSHVINILGPDGLFYSLVDRPLDMTDRALLLPPGKLPGRVAPGTEVVGDINVIEIEGNTPLLRHQASPWSGRFRPPEELVPREELLRRCTLLRRTLLRERLETGVVAALAPQGGSLFAEAVRRRLRRREYRALVGLGQGFTPSGDDLIAGIALLLRLQELYPSGTGRGSRRLRIALSRLSAQPHRTTQGGATLLALTLAGSFPAYQLEVGRRLLLPEPPGAAGRPGGRTGGGGGRAAGRHCSFEPGEVIRFAATHGESSGLDMLTGLLWAAELTAANCGKPENPRS